jgi:predicted NAD/FAD-binding protein
VFSAESLAAQRRLEAINGCRGTYFAGAYQGYGFHEDGVQSAIRVAERLGVTW